MQRLFVGDVQGCADELGELLVRARNAFGPDFEVWFVGDLVNRGPASLRVLEQVRELSDAGRAHTVLGNHEVALLQAALGLRQPDADDTYREVLEDRDAEAWLDWLRRRPLAIRGRLGETPFVLVHAAVAPEWSLADVLAHTRRVEVRLGGALAEARRLLAADPARDPDRDVLARLIQCRSVDGRGVWSADAPASPRDAWHRRWRERRHDYGVVYGHWALQGLHVAPGLRGLDTGCVHHGRGRDGFLTAWLPEPQARHPFEVPDDRFWQVRAHRRYWPFRTPQERA